MKLTKANLQIKYMIELNILVFLILGIIKILGEDKSLNIYLIIFTIPKIITLIYNKNNNINIGSLG